MHISFLLPDLKGGGAQKMIINMANHFANQGHNVDLCVMNEDGPYKNLVGDHVNLINFNVQRTYKGIKPFQRYVRAYKPDLVMSSLCYLNLIALAAYILLPARIRSRCALIVSERNNLSLSLSLKPWGERIITKIMVRLLYPFASAIVGISEGVCNDLKTHIPSRAHKKVLRIYNPVVTPALINSYAHNIADVFKDTTQFKFVASGRLCPQKDYVVMLNAFAKFIKTNPNSELVILGDGSLRESLSFLCQTLNIQKAVKFHGFVENPLAIMKQADYFLMSSAWEGFGNVLVEALYCGHGIVATNCPSGPSEILDNGTYGALSPVGKIEDFYQNLLEIVKAPIDRDKQKQRVHDFHVDKIAGEFEALFTSVLKTEPNQAGTTNILIVASKFPPEYSGPGVRLPKLYDALNTPQNRYDVHVLCNGIEQTKNEDYLFKTYPVRRRTMARLHTLFSFVPEKIRQSCVYQAEYIQTRLALKDYHPDIIHIIGHSGGTAAALSLANKYDIAVLMELVTAPARHWQKLLWLGRTQIPQNGKVIALTEKAATRAISEGLDKSQLWLRPNPVNEDIFKPVDTAQKNALRARLSPFQPNQIVIGTVAKMMPQKNQRLIIESLKHLPAHFCALLAGPFVKDGTLYERDAAYVKEMQDRVSALGLESRVHFVFDFVQAHEYMKAADIYVMPAWNEGLGTPMLEAMACGVPVVANGSEPAFVEWIIEGHNGYCAPIDSPEKWAQALEKASQFSPNQKDIFAKEIHLKAGQGAIYNQYDAILSALSQPDKNGKMP